MENGSVLLRIAIVLMLGVAVYFGLRWFLSQQNKVRTSFPHEQNSLVSVS